MTDKLEKTFAIVPSQCDSTARLGIPNAFSLFMDIATEHADQLGIGLKDLGPQNKFWLTVKSKVHFYDMPALSDVVTLTTWPEKPEGRKCIRDYILKRGDDLLVAGKTEWAVIDTSTGRLVRVDSVYPEGLVLLEDHALNEDFARFEGDISCAEEIGHYCIRSTDIDLGGHINNVAYIRAFASLFSSKEWDRMAIKDMEVWYRSQSFEGETFRVLKNDIGDAKEVYYLKEDGSVAFQLRYQ